jgi:hypothetical protein
MSFLGNYLGVQAKALHDGLVKTLVSFDPEGASEAQLAAYGDKVTELEGIAAKAETQAQADGKQAADLTADAERHIKAVELLEQQVAAETDPARKAAKQKGLTQVSQDAERLVGELETAKASAADSRGYADQMKDAHRQAVEKWTTGKTRLSQAKRDQERARIEADRAQERKADRERASGLTSGLDTTDLAVNAMAANTQKFKEKAAGARLTTDALTASSEGDAEAQAALAAVSGTAPAAGASTSSSLKDRLAALKG